MKSVYLFTNGERGNVRWGPGFPRGVDMVEWDFMSCSSGGFKPEQ